MKGKKLASLLLACAFMVSTSIPTFAQTTASQQIYSMEVNIKEEIHEIPYDILSEISKHVIDNSETEQLNKELKQRKSTYDFTSSELFDLMVASVPAQSRETYLNLFRGRQISVSFDGENIEVATVPESNTKVSTYATRWTNSDSKDRYSVRDACRETFTCYGDFESGYSNGYSYLDCVNVRSSRYQYSGYHSFTLKNSKLSRGPRRTVQGQGPLQNTFAQWDFTSFANIGGSVNHSLYTTSLH